MNPRIHLYMQKVKYSNSHIQTVALLNLYLKVLMNKILILNKIRLTMNLYYKKFMI